MMQKNSITPDDFVSMFSIPISEFSESVMSLFSKLKGDYVIADRDGLEGFAGEFLKFIHSKKMFRDSEENLEAWERGWDEQLKDVQESEVLTVDSFKPKYFRPSKYLRFKKDLIVSDNLSLEYDLFLIARHLIFQKYLSAYDVIYELGCGSCQNLFLLSELFPRKKLVGLDWTHASQEIARELSNHGRQVRGLNFDMLDPRMDDSLPRGSAVLTVHALEQIGTKHEKLLSFLLNSNPSIVVHYEPIVEFYDKNNLLDYLALIYSEKRCHLTGYLTALRKLEREKKVEIIEARRSYLGGVFHESSTLIAWRPV